MNKFEYFLGVAPPLLSLAVEYSMQIIKGIYGFLNAYLILERIAWGVLTAFPLSMYHLTHTIVSSFFSFHSLISPPLGLSFTHSG